MVESKYVVFTLAEFHKPTTLVTVVVKFPIRLARALGAHKIVLAATNVSRRIFSVLPVGTSTATACGIGGGSNVGGKLRCGNVETDITAFEVGSTLHKHQVSVRIGHHGVQDWDCGSTSHLPVLAIARITVLFCHFAA
jgi:hypothetical protein